MPLSNIAIQKAKPRERAYKLSDGGGLYLLVSPTGAKLWRIKFTIHGIEKKLSLGRYPEISLADARDARHESRKMVAKGGDPAAEMRRQKVAARLSYGTTFHDVGSEYIEKVEREGKAPPTIAKLRWVLDWLKPNIGSRPVDQIQPFEILAVLKRQESAGNLETARRTRAFASRVFRYAVATGRATSDPAALLQGAIAAPRPTHMAAIIEPKRVGDLLRAIDAYSGSSITRLALQLLTHVFVRPGELRQARWSEFDLDAKVWKIPAARMKKRREHVVPLSTQAVAIVRQIGELTAGGDLLFPALGKRGRAMSENTMTQALRRMGFDAGEMTAHGFRSTASSLLNESGKWSRDAIERALAHRDTDQVRAAYHRGMHWDERVRMAQWWSDQLEVLRMGAKVVSLRGDAGSARGA